MDFKMMFHVSLKYNFWRLKYSSLDSLMKFITLIPDIVYQDRKKRGKGDNGLIRLSKVIDVYILGCDLV